MSDSQLWRVAPILGVADVAASAEYYRDVLGFSLDPVDGLFRPNAAMPPVYGIVKLGAIWIHFQIRRDPLLRTSRNTIERDVYLYVDRVDELYESVSRAGAKVIQKPTMMAYNLYEFVVEDLNQFRIAFGEWRP